MKEIKTCQTRIPIVFQSKLQIPRSMNGRIYQESTPAWRAAQVTYVANKRNSFPQMWSQLVASQAGLMNGNESRGKNCVSRTLWMGRGPSRERRKTWESTPSQRSFLLRVLLVLFFFRSFFFLGARSFLEGLTSNSAAFLWRARAVFRPRKFASWPSSTSSFLRTIWVGRVLITIFFENYASRFYPNRQSSNYQTRRTSALWRHLGPMARKKKERRRTTRGEGKNGVSV